MDGDKTPIRGIANGKVVVHVIAGATPKHLRDMAATLIEAEKEMEERA